MNERECIAAGVDPAHVEKLERLLNKAGRLAQKMGITIFGGSGTGSLRKRADDDNRDEGPLILAILGCVQTWDGGDGGEYFDKNGLRRGE